MSVVRHFPSILGILGLDNHGLDNALKGLNEVEKFINELPKVSDWFYKESFITRINSELI